MVLIPPKLIVPQLQAHGLAKLRSVKKLAAKVQDVKISSACRVPGPHPKRICRGKSEGYVCDKICAENYLDAGICVNLYGKCNTGVCKFNYSELAKVSFGGKKHEMAPFSENPSPPSGSSGKSVGYGY